MHLCLCKGITFWMFAIIKDEVVVYDLPIEPW